MAKVIELPAREPRDVGDIMRANELYNADKLDAAYLSIEKHMMREPNDPLALVIAAAILNKAGKPSLGYQLASRAVGIAPHLSQTWNCYGHSAQLLWRMDECAMGYKKAIGLAQEPGHKSTYTNNYSSYLIDIAKYEEAEKYARDALAIDPDDKKTKHNLGLSLLAQHKWLEGWQNYSGSIGTHNRLTVKYRGVDNQEPLWDGTKDQTVVVYGEQGLGDEICAASMLPDAAKDCKRVIVECDKRLAGLFKRSFPNITVHGTRGEKQIAWPAEDIKIDASISAFEIGRFYRKDTKDFSGKPYLIADPNRVAMWKGLLASKKKPIIGIAWSGGTWHNASMHRQMALSQWAPIFKAVDAHWVSLQYKDASKEIVGTPVVQYPYGTLTQDYDDTAALVASCDLVIAVQTSVNHLAGALGVPAWAMIPKVSQWRYGEHGDSIPWYDSLKLYRQGSQGEWPVQRIADDLRVHFA